MITARTSLGATAHPQRRICDPVREIWIRVQNGGILYGESLIGISVLIPDGTLHDILAATPLDAAQVFYRDIPGRSDTC